MIQSWNFTTLGEISDVITKGTTPTSVGYKFTDDGINFVKVESLTKNGLFIDSKFAHIDEDCHESLKRSQLQDGDILFSIAGALGRTAIVTASILPANTNQALAIIRLTPSPNILTEFILLSLSSGMLLEQIEKQRGGVAQQNLSLTQLKNFNIPLPPLPEQQRIVSILDEAFTAIDQAIANTEKNLANARELFESYLNNVFTRKGDGWVENTLGEIGKVSMCKRILKNQTTASGDIPFYKIGTFGKEPNSFICNDIYQDFKEKYSFPKKGDVLISASGTIGRRVIYDGMPAYFQDSNIVWIDNNEKLVLNEYLYHFYGICDWNPSKGATISRLYNDDLRRISISFPSIVEQKKLIEIMVELNRQTQSLEAIYKNKLSSLTELKQSILQKAFSGELTSEDIKQQVNG